MSLDIGDIVEYTTLWIDGKRNDIYGIIVGFNHNNYYYVDWFGHGCDWTSPYHISSMKKV